MIRRRRPAAGAWEFGAALQIAALGLWLAFPEGPWGLVAASLGLVTVVVSARRGMLPRVAISIIGLAGSGAALYTSWQVSGVENDWDAVRESLISRASLRLSSTLTDAVNMAEALAARGANLGPQSREEAFALLEGGLAGRSPERGVVVFEEGQARPWAWAGSLRLRAVPGRNGLRARLTPFYVVLEAQREMNGRIAVGQVLLYADSAIPNRDRTVAARFSRVTGSGLEFFAPQTVPLGPDVFDYCVSPCATPEASPDTLFSVLPVPPTQGTLKLDLLARGGRRVAIATATALLVLLIVGGRWLRWFGVAATAALLVLTPFGQRLGMESFFSPGSYFLSVGGWAAVSAGTLAVLGGVVVVVAAAGWRGGRGHRRWVVVPAALGVAVIPLAMEYFASGVTPPATGFGVATWIGWSVAIALAGTAAVLSIARLVRLVGPERSVPWMPWAAGGWAVIVAVTGFLAWTPGGWPPWFRWLWLPAFLLAVQPMGRYRTLAVAAVVSGAAAALLTWGAVVEGRLVQAERDLLRFGQKSDPFTQGYLERFAEEMQREGVPRTGAELYARWRRSPLSADGYPAVLTTWNAARLEVARLELAELDLDPEIVGELAFAAGLGLEPALQEVAGDPGSYYVLSVPYPDGSVVTVAVGPRSRAVAPVRVARILRGEDFAVAPYEMALSDLQQSGIEGLAWERRGATVAGEQAYEVPGGYRHLHAQVPLGGGVVNVLIRGALLTIMNLVVASALWLFGEGLRGSVDPAPWFRMVRRNSYRTRLLVVLSLFFLVPTVGFATWSVGRMGVEVDRTRDLVVRQTLQDAAGAAIEFAALGGDASRARLDALADQLDADLLLYESGELLHSSTPVLSELGLLEPYLVPELYHRLVLEDGLEATTDRNVAGRRTRVGYRTLSDMEGRSLVLAAPRLAEVRGFGDFYALLLASVVGFAMAVWLAARAVGSLAKPVQALSDAASAVGRGEPAPSFDPGTPTEFVPVVSAFERMASDVRSHQQAVAQALQFTEDVLSNVATGVIALDASMRVTTANPRAIALLGTDPRTGRAVVEATDPVWEPVWRWVRSFAAGDGEVDAQEFTVGERRIRAQVTALTTADGGWVVALDDATELAMAERVLAWGEMARQVAHEIKNPLTPIRLGVQHLRRAYPDVRGDFETTLDRTSRQILAEIERLDAIARAFSRFGAPPAEAGPLEWVDLVEVARETASLYALGADTTVKLEVRGGGRGRLRRDELKEVLVNLIENARAAGASEITIETEPLGRSRTRLVVRDNGTGIPDEHLKRIFEPQFSTNTSGTGLGLAICKRLVESWGGSIRAESGDGRGTAIILEVG